jgi:putative molybdopterin biosynthesis protein
LRIPAATEYVGGGDRVAVRLLHAGLRPADLVAIGSHCVGLDFLLGLLSERGLVVKSIPVGSTAGLVALARGEGDVAGIHLLDEATGEYNRAFLPPGVSLLRGYGRRQGVAFRRGDADFDVPELDSFLAAVRRGGRRMVNRNPGSGTRLLLDRLLGGLRPDGYTNQPRTHHAVAAAVAQGRADWGMTLDVIAAEAGLGFLFVQEERYDLAVPDARRSRPAVQALAGLLGDSSVRARLRGLGFTD